MAAAHDKTLQFLELLSSTERMVKAFILARVPHWNDAENLMQETRIRLWEQFDAYDPQGNFGAWACTVAHYLILAYRKNNLLDRHQFSAEVDEIIAAQFRQLPPTGWEGRYRAMADCLQQLHPTLRDLVLECYSGQTTMTQVAARSGMEATVLYQRLARTREKLRRCISASLQRSDHS